MILGSKGYFSDVLKVAPMITVDSTTCEASYKILKPEFRLHKSFICARGNGAGTCSGDGGSPLVCPNENGDFIQVNRIKTIPVEHVFEGY